jgi:3-dehydroquinate synthase
MRAHQHLSYEIRHSERLLDPDDSSLLEFGSTDRRVVIMDGGLPAQWVAGFHAYFEARSVRLDEIRVPGGESAKSWDVLGSILSSLAVAHVARREDPVLVVGGGAVLDVGGLAASLFRRGVPYIRVPTTLLAHVDAAVGIKTAINLDGFKNIVGTFAPPTQVLLDSAFHQTQSGSEINAGLGEVFKLAVGCDPALLAGLAAVLEADHPPLEGGWAPMLDRAIGTMMAQLRSDPWEHTLERAVDLGHTFSLALETSAQDPMAHGHAVTVDVMLSAQLASMRGMMSDEDRDLVFDVGTRILPAGKTRLSPGELSVALDERRLHRGLLQRTPIPVAIGTCEFVNDLRRAEVEEGCRLLADTMPGNFWVHEE